MQFIVALLPVLAFQTWSEHLKQKRSFSIFIVLTCGVSILLESVAMASFQGFELNIRSVPLLIGSLYGGSLTAGALTVMFALSYIPDSGWGAGIGLAGLIIVLITVLVASIKPFQRASIKGKHIIAFLLVTGLFLLDFMSSKLDSFNHPYLYGSIWTNGWYYVFNLGTLLIGIHLMEKVNKRQSNLQELQNVSKELRTEAHMLHQLTEETKFGVILVLDNGIIMHINKQAMLYLQPQAPADGPVDLIGQPYSCLPEQQEHNQLSQLIAQALQGQTMALENIQENGKIYVIKGICMLDRQTGRVIGAAVMIHDITEMSRLRDEVGRLERLSLVGQMAASITHEIRNPMAVIRGFVQLMRERSPEHQQEYYRIVMDELDRANSIINDFLSLAQNQIIEKESCSLHDLISEMLPLLWADANLRGQSIELELAEQMPELMLNVKEMKQVILNLVRNGMEAMDQKGMLVIRTLVSDGKVMLFVIDNGCGISQEKQDRLFEPFYTTKPRGTGLGLPLCLSIVERHGGQIIVESEEGEGTRFVVIFEIEQKINEAAAAAE
ncbi:ATP-binding protein [Paenibacillus nasutitermitis]|uniref:histidine kinase n=1 Tax=Paenibacillus nasutitermitis TaxID=1652958 RepID=A0A917DLW5_9BACL|nr:ATP-binding protein [Paenibacillus nasutitermitis]GGD47111.1 hypothetical protein GCM10010911_00830 [Paenibacillus nasutitermitis]